MAAFESRVSQHGVLAKVKKRGCMGLSRQISPANGRIISETNHHGCTFAFAYDALGRTKHVDTRFDFDDIDATWEPRSVPTTRDTATITTSSDGMRRDPGSDETDDGVPLSSRKTLDAEGRVIRASRASEAADNVFKCAYQNSGGLLSSTDPAGVTPVNPASRDAMSLFCIR